MVCTATVHTIFVFPFVFRMSIPPSVSDYPNAQIILEIKICKCYNIICKYYLRRKQ